MCELGTKALSDWQNGFSPMGMDSADGAPLWSIDRSSRTRSAGSLRGVAQTDHAHNHRVLSAACMKRLVHGNFPTHLKLRLRFSRKRTFSRCPCSGVKSTHISRWASVTKLLSWVPFDAGSGKITEKRGIRHTIAFYCLLCQLSTAGRQPVLNARLRSTNCAIKGATNKSSKFANPNPRRQEPALIPKMTLRSS